MGHKIVNFTSKFIFVDKVEKKVIDEKAKLIKHINQRGEEDCYSERGFSLKTNLLHNDEDFNTTASLSLLPLLWPKVDLMLSQIRTAFPIQKSRAINQWYMKFDQPDSRLDLNKHRFSDFTILYTLDVQDPIKDAITFRNNDESVLFDQKTHITLEKDTIIIFPSNLMYQVNETKEPFTLIGFEIKVEI